MKVLLVIVGLIIGIAALALVYGWLFMLFVGAAHSYDSVIPALSYWGSFWLALAIGTVAGGSSAAGSAS